MLEVGKYKFLSEEEYNRLRVSHGSTISGGSIFIPLQNEFIFNNPDLSQKIVGVGVWNSTNSSTITYEIARRDGNTIDVDRYVISAISGGTASIIGPTKNFPEHHANELPPWYSGHTGWTV
ncbi:MAG: hypothetical protein HYY37_04965 [Candidatus Aenigmarchaeota archaeon]|nr:hypothetical protein [Candidatus Aenigmarchaeota archaeon]